MFLLDKLWWLTAASKGKTIGFSILGSWRIYLAIAALSAILTHCAESKVRGWIKAENELKVAKERIAGENESHSIGLDLNEGNNLYERETETIRIPAGSAVFDESARLRTEKRIASGESSRRRITDVR